MERMEGLIEHMLVVQKNEEEDRLERAKEKEKERRQKEDQERKFYGEFFFTDKEYFGQVDQMYSENYFGDCELTNNNSRQVKFISSKERSRRALKKEKQEERESNWITIGTLPY